MEYARYNHKRVIVTGCFSGMGEATAKLLLSIGAEVHGLDYKECTLPLASFTATDLRNRASIDAAVAKIGGKIDALFNCAGLPQTFPPVDVMQVNFIGTRYLTQKVVAMMEAGGAIASISSTGGLGWSRRIPTLMELIGTDSWEAAQQWVESHLDIVAEGYAFSKEAIIVWTMFEAAHLIKRGIRLNCILPGPTQTPMMAAFESATDAAVLDAAAQPINRRALPEEQAGPLVFLNCDAASYVNGVVLPVDGGFMGGLATGQVDISKMMAKAAK
jgi:NAD(P)-dependent dehydrogenase (short-subunit alcohol dehydrogenase family)